MIKVQDHSGSYSSIYQSKHRHDLKIAFYVKNTFQFVFSHSVILNSTLLEHSIQLTK